MSYEQAKAAYAALGVDTDRAIEILKTVPISVHCWQGDDVQGFDTVGALTGGIQATGNYPGKARNPHELMADFETAMRLTPGKKKLNLHASYAVFAPGEAVERDELEPKHFAAWVEFAKKHQMGIDFNPTLFSHPKAEPFTLTSPDKSIRDFWVRHCIACVRISEYFADELGTPCVMNIWIPDGLKDIPADRMGPRSRYADSLDRILAAGYDKSKVKICVESKVFGIGMESYTAGSAEFCMNYAATRGIVPLMDNGHYHPTEMVSDKISSMLVFHDELALHITRPVRWDSDHVVLFDDETREIAKEVVRNNALNRVYLATDFFDASINRIAAWVTGIRSVQKALLNALLTPNEMLKDLQDQGEMTTLLVMQEEMKVMPFADVWAQYCAQCGVAADASWLDEVKVYENEVLSRRV